MFDPSTLSMPFSASADRRGEAMVLALDGELDLSAKPAFEQLLEEAVDSEVEQLYVDLRGLVFIDSTGIELLLQALKTATEQGFEIAFVAGPGYVWSLLQSTGVASRLPLAEYPTDFA
jgi:anti-sigma B factor antagonist